VLPRVVRRQGSLLAVEHRRISCVEPSVACCMWLRKRDYELHEAPLLATALNPQDGFAAKRPLQTSHTNPTKAQKVACARVSASDSPSAGVRPDAAECGHRSAFVRADARRNKSGHHLDPPGTGLRIASTVIKWRGSRQRPKDDRHLGDQYSWQTRSSQTTADEFRFLRSDIPYGDSILRLC